MATSGLYGNSSESIGLYGNTNVFGGTYFQWFIFQQNNGQPVTPTGGLWNFTTNVGTPPAGWTTTVASVPTTPVWFSTAFVDSRNPTVFVWSAPSLLTSSNSIYASAYAETFTGNGTQTVFTLANSPVTVNNTDVSINGVVQVPGVDYTINSVTLTTTTAIPNRSVMLVKYRQSLPNSYYGLASNVGFTPVGTLTSTNVQSAIAEVVTDLALSSGSSTVGYLPAGTGAVATNVQAKLRQTVSVLDFGADPTGAADSSAAVQAAVVSLATKPGTILFPAGTYKIAGKVACYAGQNFIGEGAILNVSTYDGVFLSYNEADTFNLINYYPPTTISGFKVLGKVGTTIGTINPNFILAKINRTPYVSMRDITCYYAAAAWVLGESILCNFTNVICYNPISTCFIFTLGSGGFGPNNCTLYNCEIEEQKYPCTGVSITSGNINFNDCYIESLSTGIVLNGGNAAIVNTQFGIRTQTNPVGISVLSANTTLNINGGSLTFGGSSGGISQAGIVMQASTQLTFNNVSVLGADSVLDSSILFVVAAPVTGTINSNNIHRISAGTTTTLFSISNVVGADYSGTFCDNYVLADASSTLNFSSNGSGLGTFSGQIVGNRFARVGSFLAMNSNLIASNYFIGSASTISWAGYTGGTLGAGNWFGTAGWTITNATYISGENNGFGIPTIACASLISPTTQTTFVNGTPTAISNITWKGYNTITLIPLTSWATNTAGNIALGSTAVVNKALVLTYDAATAKWYPSY